MTPKPLRPDAARRVFLLLTFTRWFPVGLTVAIMVLYQLYQLDRGLSIPQALTVSAIGGLVVLLLELPTSSFSGFGRRPVYVAAAGVNVSRSLRLPVSRLLLDVRYRRRLDASSGRWTQLPWRPGTSTRPTQVNRARMSTRRWRTRAWSSVVPSPRGRSSRVAWSGGIRCPRCRR